MKIVLFLIALGAISLLPCGGTIQTGNFAQDVHENAWLNVARTALSSKAHKYGIYQSRSLAVHNPEVYLNADALFNSLLLKIPGMGSYYLERTQDAIEQAERYESIAKSGGKSFRWSDFDISRHRQVSYQEIYHTSAFLPYIDIRLHFLGAALKGTNWQATPLSMAEFLYFICQDSNAYSELFILVTESGDAYLYAENKQRTTTNLLLRCDGTEVAQPEGKIVLIFNQEHVWYPLMNRDDRSRNATLKKVVDLYAAEGNRPTLTEAEEKIVDILKRSTIITDAEDRLWATSLAAKLHVDCWRHFPEIFRQTYPSDARAGFNTSDGPQMMLARNAFIARISNWLCPATAELAGLAHQHKDESLNAIMRNTTSKYLDHVATRMTPRSGERVGGLYLWIGREVSFHNMDDHFLSKATNCIYSATNAAAIFDLAAIPDLEIFLVCLSYSGKSGGHAYTQFFKDKEFGIIENTRWVNGINGLYQGADGPIINAIIDKHGWVCLREAGFFGIDAVRASITKEEVAQLLRRIEDLSDSNARIPKAIPRGNSVTPGMTIDAFLMELETELAFEKHEF